MSRTLAEPLPAHAGLAPVEWRTSGSLVPYPEALAEMDARVAAIVAGEASELVWLLEHPPLYTSGTGTHAEDLAGTGRFPLFESGRGGRLTYHGPGQRVAYAMIDLRQRGPDLRRYVAALEEWIIRTLAAFGVTGERREDRVGVWVRRPAKGEGFEDKIAAIGVRVRKWVTLHGISVNVAPDLSHYQGILACGVAEPKFGVTSLKDLGVQASMAEVDAALRTNFEEVFGGR
jgi:lipoyl(octanoyl) transferase